MLAAFHNHPAVVLRLLRAGADMKLRNSSGNTALQWAKVKGHTECGEAFRTYLGEVTGRSKAPSAEAGGAGAGDAPAGEAAAGGGMCVAADGLSDGKADGRTDGWESGEDGLADEVAIRIVQVEPLLFTVQVPPVVSWNCGQDGN